LDQLQQKPVPDPNAFMPPQPAQQPAPVTVPAAQQGQGQGPGNAPAASGGGVLGWLKDTVSSVGRGIETALSPEKRAEQKAMAEAKGALSGLQVLPANAPAGPHQPNQVSAAEYQQAVQTYASISLGKGDLKLGTEEMDPKQAAEYKKGFMSNVAQMMTTGAGRDLVGQLNDNVAKDPVTGQPQIGADGTPIHRTTTVGAQYESIWDENGKVRTTDPGLDNGNAHAGNETPKSSSQYQFNPGGPDWQQQLIMKGKGGDTNVHWNPTLSAPGIAGGMRPDIALFHELTHGLHQTQGTMATGDVTTASPVMNDWPKSTLQNGVPTVTDKVSNEEHKTVGLGLYAKDSITENAYRRQLAQNGENVQERTSYRN
jgi:hypothetical protein